MRKTQREKMREARAGKKAPQSFSYVEFMKMLVAGDKPPEERKLNPTQLAFWMDSKSFEKAYMGAAGVAKTSTGMGEVLSHAILYPGSKLAVFRQDYNDLLGTTYRRFEEMLARLPADTLVDRNARGPTEVWLKPAAWNGKQDELSMISFMGLKGGLGSFEANGAFVDEADQCDMKAVKEILGRLRWMKGHRWVSLAFNPPDKNHWLYTACTGLNAQDEYVGGKTYTLYTPQPGENNENLPSDYHKHMTEGMPEDQIQRLVRGEWGSTFPGQPVIKQFNRGIHVQKTKFEGRILFRFWDFGYNRPCVLWCMLDREGRLHVLKEFLGHKLHIEEFISKVREMTSSEFPGATQLRDFGDPAVKQEKDTGSALTALGNAGINLGFQYTPFDTSLDSMRMRFTKLIDGKPAVIIDPSCGILIGGLAGGYCFKPDGITPRKDGYYDHEVDALRYGCWNIFGASSVFGFNPYLQEGYMQQVESATSSVQGVSAAYWDGNE